MRIKNDGLNLPTDRAGEVEGTKTQGPSGVRPGAASKTDQVELSPEAQVLRAALEQAAAQPEIRQDLVKRMQALNERGELGKDAGKLADAIIDNWLGVPREGEDG